jgi:hypothetical protein
MSIRRRTRGKTVSRIQMNCPNPKPRNYLSDRRQAAPESAQCSPLMTTTFFGLLAEFGTPISRWTESRGGDNTLACQSKEEPPRSVAKLLPCRAFRLGVQKAPYLMSAVDLAESIDRQRRKAG